LDLATTPHFTSPIRRYPDLILHRLIKAKLKDDKEALDYLLRNIEPRMCKGIRARKRSYQSRVGF